jgi:formamidopyrimidine-DNA glycosylase
MPELPDIVVYIEALEQRILNQTLDRIQIGSPFLLRTVVPPISSGEGKKVVQLRRVGKRICIGLEGDLWLVLHLMIAGRLHWKEGAVKDGAVARPSGRASSKGRNNLAIFQFPNGTLSLTEAGSQRRASLHLVEGEAGLERLDPGGVEILKLIWKALRMFFSQLITP